MISEVRSICKQIKDYKWQNHPDFKRISLDMIENTVNAAKERSVYFSCWMRDGIDFIYWVRSAIGMEKGRVTPFI